MNIYSISSLLDLSNKIENNELSISFPFLESFYGKYSQKVTEDRKVPLFSKTTKYNNFPVRCQWKNNNKNNNKNTKKKNKNGWRKEGKIAPTKIKKLSGIKGLAMTILNKITENSFEKQSEKLLQCLLDNKGSDSGYIIAKLILEKIWYDKGFYELYVNLCKKLWDNNEWTSETYDIIVKNKKYYYEVNHSTNKLYGPFDSEDEANENAEMTTNFKNIFISICRDNFYRRDEFIKEARELPDSNKKYILKRRLFGTIQILGYLYKLNHLNENVIHYLLTSMFEDGVSNEEEIEAIKLLWDIVSSKINKNIMREYSPLIEKEMEKKLSMRINFMCEDMLNSLNQTFKTHTFRKTFVKKKSDKEIIDELVKLSRNEKKDFNIQTLSSSLYEKILIKIIKDLTEYGEFMNQHLNFITYFINSLNIKDDTLSNSITNVIADILEIKLDAPKASSNLKYFLSKINKNITINLNNIEYDYYEPNEIKTECDNIVNSIKNVKVIYKSD